MISIIKRIIIAHKWRSSNDLISTAIVFKDSLIVFDCNLNLFWVPFSSLSALNKIKIPDRSKFTIPEDGSYIYWEKYDIHLDLEAFKSIPKYFT